jgi:hypothetical protein
MAPRTFLSAAIVLIRLRRSLTYILAGEDVWENATGEVSSFQQDEECWTAFDILGVRQPLLMPPTLQDATSQLATVTPPGSTSQGLKSSEVILRSATL